MNLTLHSFLHLSEVLPNQFTVHSPPSHTVRVCAPARARLPIISLSSLPPSRPSIHIMPSGRGNLIHLRPVPPLYVRASSCVPLSLPPSLPRVPIFLPEA